MQEGGFARSSTVLDEELGKERKATLPYNKPLFIFASVISTMLVSKQ